MSNWEEGSTVGRSFIRNSQGRKEAAWNGSLHVNLNETWDRNIPRYGGKTHTRKRSTRGAEKLSVPCASVALVSF